MSARAEVAGDRQSISSPHVWSVRVYYEDTDLAGVVYYANYLRFIERARTEMLRALGIDQSTLKDETGSVFVVRRCEIDYLAPARFDDELAIATHVLRCGRASLDLSQDVMRGEDRLAAAVVRLAHVGASGRPTPLPSGIRAALSL